jgi:hypothetical protein
MRFTMGFIEERVIGRKKLREGRKKWAAEFK